MSFKNLADWLAWQETLHPRAIDLDLGRFRRVLERLGWQPPAYPVITVGGTNGKGSCVALLDSVLTAAGYRTGTFTSPHLVRYNERIRIAATETSDASLVAAFERIEAARGDDTLTFFEFNTLAALLVFATAGVDCVILEVGMGGRLDAVNVIDPDVALITSIGLDHCEWLGTTVEQIGAEKAGILRAGRPAIFGSRAMPAAIQSTADRIGAPLFQLGREFDFAAGHDDWSWHMGAYRYDALPRPALAGAVQYENAAAIIATLRAVHSRLPVPHEALATGLRLVRLAGRFEIQAGRVTWIFDVAHNPAAARVLADNLANLPTTGRTIAVCGILGDKDIAAIATELRASIDMWVLAALSGPRAANPELLRDRFDQAGIRVVRAVSDVASACAAALAMATAGDRIVVFGSFLTVGPAREWHAAHRRQSGSLPLPHPAD